MGFQFTLLKTKFKSCLKSSSGLSLLEVMIGLTVASICFLAFGSFFTTYSQSVHAKKARLLAHHLADNKMSSLVSHSFYRIVPSTSAVTATEIPNNKYLYDSTFYPPEIIERGGLSFIRRVYVKRLLEEPDSDSEEMTRLKVQGVWKKEVQVHVIWQERNRWRHLSQKMEIEGPAIPILASSGLSGRLSGDVLLDGEPLPGMPMMALLSGFPAGLGVSNSEGDFVIESLRSGRYTVIPLVEEDEMFSPKPMTVAVSPGEETSVETFKVIPSYGWIEGRVTKRDNPISTGVLIIASSKPLGILPPVINADFRSGTDKLYSTASEENGSFRLKVPGGTLGDPSFYHVYGWFSEESGEISRRYLTAKVIRSQTTKRMNFSWF